MDYDDVNHQVQIKSSHIGVPDHTDVDDAVEDIDSDSSSAVQLTIQCKDLAQMDVNSNSDPFVVVYMAENGKWIELGRTEVLIDEPNPKFIRSFRVNYYFELVQTMRFVVYDANDFKVPPENISFF